MIQYAKEFLTLQVKFAEKIKESIMNIKNRPITGLSSCERAHQIIEPGMPEAGVPVRDHVWVVNQNGVEVPVPGTWVLVSHTHLNSTSTNGLPTLEYGEYPFDLPGHNVQIWEKQ